MSSKKAAASPSRTEKKKKKRSEEEGILMIPGYCTSWQRIKWPEYSTATAKNTYRNPNAFSDNLKSRSKKSKSKKSQKKKKKAVAQSPDQSDHKAASVTPKQGGRRPRTFYCATAA